MRIILLIQVYPRSIITIIVVPLGRLKTVLIYSLKNITLGYTIPATLLAKTKVISYVRVYVTGADLWETSKINDGWDPEASRKVSGYGRYPFTRNVTFGLNLTF